MRLRRMVLFLTLILGSVAVRGAQAPIEHSDSRWTYIIVRSPTTLTVTQDGAELAKVIFASGTTVALSDGKPHPSSRWNGLQGTVEVRAKREADMKPGSAALNFNEVPLILRAQGVEARMQRND
jgi:hypothetical protein